MLWGWMWAWYKFFKNWCLFRNIYFAATITQSRSLIHPIFLLGINCIFYPFFQYQYHLAQHIQEYNHKNAEFNKWCCLRVLFLADRAFCCANCWERSTLDSLAWFCSMITCWVANLCIFSSTVSLLCKSHSRFAVVVCWEIWVLFLGIIVTKNIK